MRSDAFIPKLVAVPLGLAIAAMLLWIAMGMSGGDGSRVDLDLAERASAAPLRSPAPVDRARDQAPVSSEAPAKPRIPKTTILTVRGGAEVDLLDAPAGKLVATLADSTEFGSPTVLTVQKRRAGWAGVPTHLLPNGKLGWVRIDSKALKVDQIGVRIVVDLSDKRARLLRGEKTEPEHRWQVGIGAPDSPTPTGSFSITDKLEGTDLNPVYGCCALALSATQPNLPEGWTAGNRMAIHGPSGPLGQELSAGCVWSADEDLRVLMEKAPLGTPVEIRR